MEWFGRWSPQVRDVCYVECIYVCYVEEKGREEAVWVHDVWYDMWCKAIHNIPIEIGIGIKIIFPFLVNSYLLFEEFHLHNNHTWLEPQIFYYYQICDLQLLYDVY